MMEVSESVPTAVQAPVVQARAMGVTVHVSDLERSMKFYEETLGFRKAENQMLSPAVLVQAGDMELYLNPGSEDMGRRSGACPEISIYLVVDGVRAACERLRTAGVTLIGEYHEPSPAFASVQLADPDGNMIELMGNP